MTKPERKAGLAGAVPETQIEVLELMDIGSVNACLDLQRSIWGASDPELVPVSQMRAAQHAGGLLAGAVLDGELVGFCYGFPAHRPAVHEGPGLHSHMTGVIATARSRGVGGALKQFQRNWCLERGIRWIEWTFDPLRAANARFNLEHLGASAGEYLIDTYGDLDDDLNAGLPSDRLVACWSVEESASRVRELPERVEPVLIASESGAPYRPRLGESSDDVSIAVPNDLGTLLALVPEVALNWRLASRTAFRHYLGRGYLAERFIDGAYLLHRESNE